MNKHIRKYFPALKKSIYLNCAAVGPIPTFSIAAVTNQLRDVSLHGSTNYQDWIDTKDRARNLIAKMMGVKSEQIAFMRNTSDGLATIGNGLSWKKGDNIVSFSNEFPANFYAWRRLRDVYDVELRLCPERDGRIDLDEFIGLIDADTKLVAISAVQFSSGFKADLERIGAAARKVDALFVVDIIQGLGTMPFDLPAQNVDAACGGSHKWLLSPEGCGMLFLSDRARERIEPTLVGWCSVGDPWNFDDQDQTFKPTALAWETGTSSSSLYYGLEQSLRFIDEMGASWIESYLGELTDFLCEILPQDRYEVLSSRAETEKSQIVCVKHRGDKSSSDIFKHLEARGIIVSARGDSLRISSHFFNNQEDIKQLVENLP